MSLLTANNLAKSYGPDDIFEGISIEIPHKARIALVGPNGAGKTSLLNILVGLDTPTLGNVSMAKGLRIGFLPQRPELAGEHSIWEEMMLAFTDLRRMETRLAALEADLNEANLQAYGELQQRFEESGGYTYESRIKMVLHGLSFTPKDYDTPLTRLSGGQRTRALLGRLLLDNPDVLVLDEPTNHLDINAVEWLESFLRDFPGAVLAVSHDRYFMDAFAANIWEMDFGTLETYRGNYSHYTQQRQERYERRLKEYEAQQEFLAKEQEYIRRNIAGQNTAQAKGKRRRLETLRENGGLLTRPRQNKTMNLAMGSTVRSGDKVLVTRALTVGYPGKPLLNVSDETVWRGDVVALIGPNGVGKTTLIKTLIGQLAPLAGDAKIGASVKIGYFAQAHELLNPKNSILDEVSTVKSMLPAEARTFLGQFLFSGDDVFRTIETLSGGERGRVALAKLALSGSNLMLLDEPSNHLDIASQEILQNVLVNFPGTILLISHDRYLINALATRIWSATPGHIECFEGTYNEWVAARQKAEAVVLAENEAARPVTSPSNGATASAKKHGLNAYQLKKRLSEVEARISQLEDNLSALTDALGKASTAGDAGRVQTLGGQYNDAEAALHAAMTEWETLME